jgi:predicted alpha/beta-fold hydrolase
MKTILGILLLTAGVAASEMPELDHLWPDGLYSTITAPDCCGGVAPKNARRVKLRVPGFKKDLCARAVVQEHRAPLVVILNGTFGKANDGMTNLWMAWLEANGWHVFSFDSTFHYAFTSAAQIGVAGNLEVEAETAGQVIQAFLERPEISGKVTRIGVVGMSYGGIQALNLARLSKLGRLPFHLDAAQAYSAPVSMWSAMRILDDGFGFQKGVPQLAWDFLLLKREWPVKTQYAREDMRLALSRVFRLDLQHVVETNDRLFDKELAAAGCPRLDIPKEDPAAGIGAGERVGYAAAVNFQTYFRRVVAPYWIAKGRARNAEDILRLGDLSVLVRECGDNARVILAANDPLNEEGAVERLRAEVGGAKLTVLPRGGHLGFVNAEWTRTSLRGLFSAARTVDVAKASGVDTARP